MAVFSGRAKAVSIARNVLWMIVASFAPNVSVPLTTLATMSVSSLHNNLEVAVKPVIVVARRLVSTSHVSLDGSC